MAHSPSDGNRGRPAEYQLGWIAVNELMRRGFSWSGRERNCVFLNTPAGGFADVSAVSGIDFPDDARGAAVVDWDQDGWLDLWVTNRSAPRARFLRNLGAGGGRSTALLLEGTSCNADALGARVEVVPRGSPRRHVQTVRAGEGYLSQSSRWLHFGLGDAEAVERVVVRWPGGAEETFTGVEPGRRFVLRQGAGAARPQPARVQHPRLEPETPRVPAPSERARLVLAERVPMVGFEHLDRQGRTLRAPEGSGALLVNLWASWCPPCVGELRQLAARAEELRAAGLAVLALSVDEADTRPGAEALLDGLAWPFGAGYATEEALDLLDLLQRSLVERKRRLPLPTSFLVDRRGWLAAVYKGPVEVDQLLADAELLDLDPAELPARVLPLPGIRHTPPGYPLPSIVDIVGALLAQGRLDAAADYHRHVRLPPGAAGDPQLAMATGIVQEQRLKLAVALSRAERSEQATEVFGAMVEVDPENAVARGNFALGLAQLGRDVQALPHLEAVLERQPRNHQLRVALGASLARLGRAADAEACFRRVLAERPEHAQAHLHLGLLHANLGRDLQAREHLERALRADPHNEQARSALARLQER